jgi:ABC-2 type transport system permease protein
MFFSVFFWIYSLKKLEIQWSTITITYYLLTLISGFIIFSAITVITGTISFWTVKSEEIVSLLTDNNYGLKNFCDYPIQIYSKGPQFLLTFIVPYALTGYYPVANLLGKHLPYTWIAYTLPMIAIIIAITAYKFWHIGLKHYGSTGA